MRVVSSTRSTALAMRSRWMREFGSLSSNPIASMRCGRSRSARAFSKDNGADGSGITKDTVRPSIFFERAADRVVQVLRLRWLGRVVSGGFFGRDFDMRVGRYEIVGDRHAFNDFDALAGQRVVFHIAHRDETIDPLQSEPVHHVRHQLLEPAYPPPPHPFAPPQYLPP